MATRYRPMKFCDCQNLLTPVIGVEAYFECMICKKRHEFGPGDTLIRPAATRPDVTVCNEHIVRYLPDKNVFATVDDTPCPTCAHQFAKVLIAEGQTWYGCLACRHTYTAR